MQLRPTQYYYYIEVKVRTGTAGRAEFLLLFRRNRNNLVFELSHVALEYLSSSVHAQVTAS